MIFQLRSYFKFLINSTNSYGVHSPFVFNLITQCLNNNTQQNSLDYLNFKKHKKQLLKNKSIINITDFGSGSKHFKSNQRRVSDIVKYAGITNKKAYLLHKIITYYKPKSVLEIGTSVGLATYIFASNLNSKIITLEGCQETLQVAKKYLSKFNNINFVLGNFDNTLPKITHKENFDLIYFDGNHTEEATLNYFNICLEARHNKSLFVFDDIYLNKPMQTAWQKIIKHSEVSVSIDTYYLGFIFFRKEQNKQHFIIRTNS